jgi:hypothetical protein
MSNNKAHGDLWDKAITANPLRDNGATVIMGGNIDSTPTVTQALAQTITGAGKRQPTGVYESAYTGATNANSGGTFAKLAAGQYVMKGGNVTTQLAGVAYRGLRGAGNQNQIRGIHTLLTRSTVLIDSWDYATGTPTYNVGNPSSDDFDINSSYAAPTRALPGNLVMIDDGKSTTVVAYAGKE